MTKQVQEQTPETIQLIKWLSLILTGISAAFFALILHHFVEEQRALVILYSICSPVLLLIGVVKLYQLKYSTCATFSQLMWPYHPLQQKNK